MKTLVSNQTSTEAKVVQKITKTSIKRNASKKMNELMNRTENLVDVYFELGLQDDLREQLKQIKTNGIENMIDCFESDDKSKFVSFLRKVYDLPFFVGVSLKGINPDKFVSILVDLCTIKDNTTKNIKCHIVGTRSENPFSLVRPDTYDIQVSFDTKVIEMLFQAYI